MNSAQRSPFPLLNAIQEQIHEPKVFKSVKFENNNSKNTYSYDLSFFGPFIALSKNQISSFSIFLPNFLPLVDSRQPEKVLFHLSTNQKLQYSFIFSSKDDAKKFYDASLTVLENFQPLIKNVNLNFCKINEDFIVLLPNSTQIANCNVFVGFEKDSTGNHAVLNVNSNSDSKRPKKPKIINKSKKKEKDFSLELKMSSKINITQPAEIPKAFGEDTFRKVTAEVFQNENEKCLILCKTVEESFNLILSIYFLSHSTQDLNSQKFNETSKIPAVFLAPPKPSVSFFKSVDPCMKPRAPLLSKPNDSKQITIPKIEIEPVKPSCKKSNIVRSGTIIIPDEVNSNQNNNNINTTNTQFISSQNRINEESDHDDDFILEFEEVIITNAKENKLSQKRIDYERSARSRTNTLSRRGSGSPLHRRSTITRRGNINLELIKKREEKNDENELDNEIDFNYFRPSSTSTVDFDGNCEKSLENINKMINSLEQERKKAQANESIENFLPDFETFVKGLNPLKYDMIIQGDASINTQLEKSFEVLKSNSYDDQFTSIKKTNSNLDKTDQIVKNSIEFFSGFSLQSETNNDDDFFKFFDFKSFPSYKSEELKSSTEPHLEFFDKLVSVIQSIEVKKITKLYSDTGGQKQEQVGQQLTALISTIFINGLRGFEKVNDISSRDYEVCSNLINSIRVISGSIPDLISIVNQLTKMLKNGENNNSGCDIATLASALAVQMMNDGILIHFLRTIQKNDEWINRFYLPTSILASSHVISMSIILLTPLFCNIQFLLSIESSGSCLFNQSTEFIDTIVKTPAQGFLEVDPLVLLSNGPVPSSSSLNGNVPVSTITSMSSFPRLQFDLSDSKNATDIRLAFQHSIVHQFGFGLKPSFIKIPETQRQFSFINEVATSVSLSSKSPNKDAWKEFVETTKLLKNTNGMMIKEMSYVIEEWVSVALEKKLLHIWLLFLGVNTDIVNKFYYPCSTFADPYRLKFVIKAIDKFYKSMEHSKYS